MENNRYSLANNLGITTNDFENICRTCLSREGLRPMYEEYLVEMLMSCTVVKFAENDGLPTKICVNCIFEINKAFSFAKCCETSDKILRKCVIKLETEVVNNPSHSQKVEPPIKTEEEIKPEIIYGTVKEVVGEYECMEEVKQEEDVKMEFVENWMKVEGNTKIEIECNETYDDSVDASNEVKEEVQNENSDNPNFRSKRMCTNSLIVKIISKDDDCETYEDSADESYEEEDDNENQDEVYSEKPDNPGCRIKHKTINPQINEGSTKTLDQHKRDRHSKSSNRINQCQKGIQTGENLYTCEVCSKSLSQNLDLKRHMRTHTGEKPYTCEMCNKNFSRNEHLKIHMRIHTGEKPYTCDICSKCFGINTNLKSHMRIHTGEKPYTCRVCSKGFSHNSALQRHIMRIHTGEKPYTCNVCSKAFSLSESLKIHMRIHTGEKPYICEVCSKAFSISANLKKHEITHRR